ncbi:MAG: hypothetical protein HY231_04755 [Acidobacteria bacterium]|nr:hypothetical protein [Acidobacteriota bacterium]
MANETSFSLPLDFGVRANVKFSRRDDATMLYSYSLEVEKNGSYMLDTALR